MKEQNRNRCDNVFTQDLASEAIRRLDYGDSVSAVAKALRIPYDSVYNIKSKGTWK